MRRFSLRTIGFRLQSKVLPRRGKDLLTIVRRRRHWIDAGIIFVHIPRAAGTSISYALYGRALGHLRAKDISLVCPDLFKGLPVFAVTRNPWDRLVSAYEFARTGRSADAGMHNAHLYGRSPFASFEGFVTEWLSGRDLSTLDYVFQPQHAFVANDAGQFMVDFLGRVEDIARVETYLTETLGRPLSIGRRNLSSRSSYREYYQSSSLKYQVGEIYRQDVDLLGYHF